MVYEYACHGVWLIESADPIVYLCIPHRDQTGYTIPTQLFSETPLVATPRVVYIH